MQVLFEIMVQIKPKRGIGVETPSPRSFSSGVHKDLHRHPGKKKLMVSVPPLPVSTASLTRSISRSEYGVKIEFCSFSNVARHGKTWDLDFSGVGLSLGFLFFWYSRYPSPPLCHACYLKSVDRTFDQVNSPVTILGFSSL